MSWRGCGAPAASSGTDTPRCYSDSLTVVMIGAHWTPTLRRWGSGMELTRSAHVDTSCRDSLPPPEHWPEFLTDLPELRYPERRNCASTLRDEVVAARGRDRPCLRTDDETWSYGELLA